MEPTNLQNLAGTSGLAHSGPEPKVQLRVIQYVSYFILSSGERSEQLQKVVYLQNRRFLPETSGLRRDQHNFPHKREEHNPPPSKKNSSEMRDYHKAVDNAKKR